MPKEQFVHHFVIKYSKDQQVYIQRLQRMAVAASLLWNLSTNATIKVQLITEPSVDLLVLLSRKQLQQLWSH